ncbi:hypothetical protein B0H67DRAFT_552484 [Lasiosphaeris hirsuta]|uniref:Uncharacterized protein n=1 Tax=Lasiosphaeris hirsuta TaxID=260670 RepID=A0AA40AQS0_9PEZI|nr:hypothetical protein B0H67DRAFT_552484 [Lasiosphaeris hirsuta]
MCIEYPTEYHCGCTGEPRIEPCVGAMTSLLRGQDPKLCNPTLPARDGEVIPVGIKCERDRRDRVGRRKLSHHKAWLREAEAERDRFWKHKIFSPLKKDASQRLYAQDLRQEAEEELERNMVAWERDAELYGISLYDSYDRWLSCLKEYTKRRLDIDSTRASTSMSKIKKGVAQPQRQAPTSKNPSNQNKATPSLK